MAARNNTNSPVQFAAIGCLFLAFGAAVVVSAYFYLTRSAEAAIYRSALECAAQTTDESHCRRQTSATVERIFVQSAGAAKGKLTAHFRLPDGGRIQTQFSDAAFGERLRQGEQVTAEMWHGQMTRVKTGGRDEPTAENPETNVRNILIGGAMAVVPLGAIAVSVLLITLFRRRRTNLN